MAEPAVEEYADTQFFSQFWVISQNRRTGEVRLRDTRTCRNFDVIDREIACQRAWAHGLIGVRLAQVDGACTPRFRSTLSSCLRFSSGLSLPLIACEL